MENWGFFYPNVKSSSKYAFTVVPTHHTSMAWACSRALPDDATSPKQCQWHSQSCILLYIHHEITWARNIRVFCLETQPFPGALILTDCSQIREQSPPKYRITTGMTSFLTAFSVPLLISIFSPPFPLRNSSILLKGSLTSLKYHSDTRKCLLKRQVLSEEPEAQGILPEHWPLWACSPTTLVLLICLLSSHLLISNYQIFQWNNLFLSSVPY